MTTNNFSDAFVDLWRSVTPYKGCDSEYNIQKFIEGFSGRPFWKSAGFKFSFFKICCSMLKKDLRISLPM